MDNRELVSIVVGSIVAIGLPYLPILSIIKPLVALIVGIILGAYLSYEDDGEC